MPQQQSIPCTDCDEKKREIEAPGVFKVLSCDPDPANPGWCIISFDLADGAANAPNGGN